MPSSHKILDFVSLVLLIITLAVMQVFDDVIENVIRGKTYVLENLLIGTALACIWMYILYRFNRSYFEGAEKRASAVLMQIFSIIILTIFLNGLYNYNTGKQSLTKKLAVVKKKTINIKYGTRYMMLYMDNRLERFNPDRDAYDSLKVGDTTVVTIGKGNLGYSFIYKFTDR